MVKVYIYHKSVVFVSDGDDYIKSIINQDLLFNGMADDIINSNDGNDYLNLEKIGGSVILTLDKDGIGEKHNAQKFIDFGY